jgi:hypothetical protein
LTGLAILRARPSFVFAIENEIAGSGAGWCDPAAGAAEETPPRFENERLTRAERVRAQWQASWYRTDWNAN